ncbi:MAG TPA: hypothetical protein VFW53_05395 [Gallionella sp.]|nr:hypothetical protein [Gallionella sp.]
MKKILVIAAVVAVAIAAVFFFVSNPVGKLAKLAIEEFGPRMTQTDVKVKKIVISASDGRGSLSGLLIGNPKGFKTDYALKADTIGIEIEPASIAKDVIVIHNILIDAPSIIYEKGDNLSNFDAIQRNVEQFAKTSQEADKNADKSGGKKMIIDTFIIRNAKVNYNGLLDLSLPDIELHNIGKKTGGATSAQVTKTIVAELNGKLALAVAKAVVIGSVGGVALGIGMGVKSLLGK